MDDDTRKRLTLAAESSRKQADWLRWHGADREKVRRENELAAQIEKQIKTLSD